MLPPEQDSPVRNDARIAAIIPLYNGAPYIRQAIESLLHQSLAPTEIIVVNDGSTDAGPQIVESLARAHPIRLLHKANGGQGSARNLAVANSNCDLIAPLDQDDVWYRNHLDELARPFGQPRAIELGPAYSNLDEIDEEGRLVVRSVLRLFANVQHPKRDVEGCLRTDMYVLPSASLISRRAFDAVGGFDERLRGYEDDDLFLRLFRAGYDNVYLDEPCRSGGCSRAARPIRRLWRPAACCICASCWRSFPTILRGTGSGSEMSCFPAFLCLRWRYSRMRCGAMIGNLCARRSRTFGSSRATIWRVRAFMTLLLPLLRFPCVARTLVAARSALLPLSRRVLG
jgi:glycosyltransferase involved in cell wall biosynthesis